LTQPPSGYDASNGERDERFGVEMDPEESLRALLKVDPGSEPTAKPSEVGRRQRPTSVSSPESWLTPAVPQLASLATEAWC
jgi:hypothetical protein